MHLSSRSLLGALAIGGLMAAADSARAGGIDVTPPSAVLERADPGVLLKVSNHREGSVRLRVTAYAWTQGDDGEAILKETDELALTPSRLEVDGWSAGVIRAVAAPGPDAAERAYQVVIEELSEDGRRARTAIPVFLEAEAPRRDPRVDDAMLDAAGLVSFRLRNAGSVHIHPRVVELVGFDDRGREVLRERAPSSYVLPGSRLDYELSLGAQTCELVARAEIRVHGDRYAWSLTRPLAAPRCPDT